MLTKTPPEPTALLPPNEAARNLGHNGWFHMYRVEELPPLRFFLPFQLWFLFAKNFWLDLLLLQHHSTTGGSCRVSTVHWRMHGSRFYVGFEKFCENIMYFLQRRFAFVRPFVCRLERRHFQDFYPLTLQPYLFDTKNDYYTLRTFESRGPYAMLLKDPIEKKRFYPKASIEELVTDLFSRRSAKEGGMIKSRNSLWYPCLATFHHYSVFSADDDDFASSKNVTHHAHLQSLYGITEATTNSLRLFENGLLKSSIVNGEEFLPYLKDCPGCRQKGRAHGHYNKEDNLTEEERNTYFACGNDRVNSSPMFLYPAVLYLRMHNNYARALQIENPSWDDERLFQEARNLNIACHFKHLIHDIRFNFGDAFSYVGMKELKSAPQTQGSGVSGAITYESKLAYIFHEAIPDEFELRKKFADENGDQIILTERVSWEKLYWNPQKVTELGTVCEWMDCLTRQRCGRLCLRNTPKRLLRVHSEHLTLARTLRMPTLNEYREQICSLPAYKSFQEVTRDVVVQEKLKKHYGTVDNLEFFTGIYAEDPWPLDENLSGYYGLPDYLGPVYSLMVKSTLSQLAFNSPFLHPNVLEKGMTSKLKQDVLDCYDNNYWFESCGVPMNGRNAFFSDDYRSKYLKKDLVLFAADSKK